MLNLHRPNLDKIKQRLLRQQKDVEKQLKEIEQQDPVTAPNLAVEVSESGTDSWLAEAHGRLLSVRDDLRSFYVRITGSLTKIQKGTYGKCESCGKHIEPERLEALPTATLCVSCSQKSSK